MTARRAPRLTALLLAGLVVLLTAVVVARALEPARQALWLTEDERCVRC